MEWFAGFGGCTSAVCVMLLLQRTFNNAFVRPNANVHLHVNVADGSSKTGREIIDFVRILLAPSTQAPQTCSCSH